MPVCVACSTELDPQWNYCISCGVPVVGTAARASPVTPAIPSAIRPDILSPAATRSPIPRAALVVIALAVVGSIGAFIAAIQVLR